MCVCVSDITIILLFVVLLLVFLDAKYLSYTSVVYRHKENLLLESSESSSNQFASNQHFFFCVSVFCISVHNRQWICSIDSTTSIVCYHIFEVVGYLVDTCEC